jgi:prepilin-type N-terminal cleavage/methylation domain-containing protein
MRRNGYTIIEILAAIVVFSIMMGVAVVSFRGTSDKDRLKTELVRVAGIIREARSRAYNGIIPSGASAYPLGGYGVYMNKTTKQIVLFADNDGDNYYDSGEELTTSTLNSKLNFTFIKKSNPQINQEVIKFNGDDYPTVYNQDACPPGGPPPNQFCLNHYIAIPTSGTTKNVMVQIFAGVTCNGRIKVSDKSATVQPLLIDTALVSC